MKSDIVKVPYIDPSIFRDFVFEKGDVVVSCPIKCGTHWTMMQAYSILASGDTNFSDIYERVPWIEFKSFPEQTNQERVASLAAVKFNTPGHRVFKSHMMLPPGPLPFLPDVRYVVTGRCPWDMVVSIVPFFQTHKDEFFAAWGLDDPEHGIKVRETVMCW
jgi:hypothetical protein